MGLAAVLLFLLITAMLPVTARAETVWIEGEAPAASTMHRHPWFNDVKTGVLSGGNWISNFSKQEGTADYKVAIKEGGDYVFWVRAVPTVAVLSYALDGGEWTRIDLTKDKRGEQNIATDGKPDLRFIAWVRAGTVKLPAGDHTVRFRMHGTADNHGGLDCFLLTNDGFFPQGALKPGAAPGGGPADWFALLPGEDRFSPGSVIDMSSLTEAPAGKFGPVIAKGSTLAFAQRADKAVKFWGCGANLQFGKLDRPAQQQRIRYLRKFGVNAARQHPLFDEITTNGKIDPPKLDAYDWWFAELKKAGIYTQWSVFYHFPISAADGYDPELLAELEPMPGGLRDSYGIITMSEALWNIRTKVLVSLLDHRNPYTGLRYADDPALMAVEYQNEDSIFFWNPLSDLASENPKKWKRHARLLRRMFAAWAKKKYGSDDALRSAWGKLDREPADDELWLMGPWEINAQGIRGRFAGNTKRAGDQTQFLIDLQTALYKKCEDAIRATGFKAQTITTNWLAGSSLLDQANIFTDTIGTMIDRHNYAGGGAGVHGIAEGQVYAESHLGKPGALLFSIALKQVEDRPFSMSEWTMCPPNQWKLEAAPIFAFYGMGLQGWDVSFHFTQSGTRLGDGWPDMSSYRTDTPHYIGQFPALAFALHKGHLKESPVVAARRVEPAELTTGRPAWLQDYYDGEQFFHSDDGTPQEVFAIGRVTAGFRGGKNETPSLTKFWDRTARVITSASGELTWDYGRERIMVQTSKTQAVIGKAGTVMLPSVKVECATPFVSLIFTPLDDRPLAESKSILITAMAQDKQSGSRYSADGTKLLATGTAPLLLEPVQATIKLTGATPAAVTPLDPWGYRHRSSVSVAPDGSFRIDGTNRAYYYEVTR